MAATSGSSVQDVQVRKQASLDRQAVNTPVALLLQQPTLYSHLGYAKLASTRPGRHWTDWGTLLNRKLEVRDSTLGEAAGRGLFAGPRADGFEGFKAKQVITIYGGTLLTKRQVDAAAREAGGHDYMLRISAKGGSMQFWVDGKQFASGLTRQVDDVYLPAPEDEDRMTQGAASLANDPRNAKYVNAEFKFYQLGTGDAAKLLPRVPVLVAKCDIAPGDEVFVSYNTEKPLAEGALVAEGGAGQGRKRPRVEDADEADDEPAFRSCGGGDVEEGGSSSAPSYRSAVASDEFAGADAELLAAGEHAQLLVGEPAAEELADAELLAALARL